VPAVNGVGEEHQHFSAAVRCGTGQVGQGVRRGSVGPSEMPVGQGESGREGPEEGYVTYRRYGGAGVPVRATGRWGDLAGFIV
jgi:hypothetical protein